VRQVIGEWLEVDALTLEPTLHAEPTAAEPDALALLIYASGTTGKPKGVMLEHAISPAMMLTSLPEAATANTSSLRLVVCGVAPAGGADRNRGEHARRGARRRATGCPSARAGQRSTPRRHAITLATVFTAWYAGTMASSSRRRSRPAQRDRRERRRGKRARQGRVADTDLVAERADGDRRERNATVSAIPATSAGRRPS
jgi:acyl-CoA synthetase (AMP-forming)/AMP-acid ligase II